MEISPKLAKGIRRANEKVYDALIRANPEETKADYLDVSHNEGEISFLPVNRKAKNPYKATNLRTSGKPLRILKKFVKSPVDPWVTFDSFDMSFSHLTTSSFMDVFHRDTYMREMTDRDWENFLYALKPTIQEVPLTLVEGEDIRKYYLRDNYSSDLTLSTLHNSCMRSLSNQPQMDLYVHNPNVKMLVELDERQKVRGRAIVWTLTTGEIFMDRVYGNETTTQIFRMYADKQGWLHRTYNSYQNTTHVTTSEGRKIIKSMMVHLPDVNCRKPWMDTFKGVYRDEVNNNYYLGNDLALSGYEYIQRIN